MLKKGASIVALAWGMGLAAAGWAAAGDTPNHIRGKFGVFGNAGFSTFAMENINASIDALALGYEVAGYTAEATYVYGGSNYNAGVQYALFDHLAVGLEAGWLTADARLAWKGTISGMDRVDMVQAWKLPATELGAFAKAMLPVGSRILLNLRVGLNFVQVNGTIRTMDHHAGTVTENALTGSAVGAKAATGLEVFLADYLSLGVDLGYRIARIGEVRVQDDHAALVGSFAPDYTGVFFQGGVRFYF